MGMARKLGHKRPGRWTRSGWRGFKEQGGKPMGFSTAVKPPEIASTINAMSREQKLQAMQTQRVSQFFTDPALRGRSVHGRGSLFNIFSRRLTRGQ